MMLGVTIREGKIAALPMPIGRHAATPPVTVARRLIIPRQRIIRNPGWTNEPRDRQAKDSIADAFRMLVDKHKDPRGRLANQLLRSAKVKGSIVDPLLDG